MRGTENCLHQAGVRRKQALAVYNHPGDPLYALADGRLALPPAQQPPDLARRRHGGGSHPRIHSAKQVLYRMVRRYRRKLQEALPDTVDLLGIVLGTGLSLDQAMMRVSEEMDYIYPSWPTNSPR